MKQLLRGVLIMAFHIVLGFIVGTVLGSFVKALADRSLTNRSFWGRSYCPKCKQKLHWYDLLPIVSYLLLRGKCGYCQKSISIEYLLVEVMMGILIGYLFSQNLPPFGWNTIATLHQFSIFLLDLLFKIFFITVLAILFLTDIKKMFIPDRIVVPAMVISIIFITVITIIKVIFLYYYLTQTLIGQKLLPPYSDYFQRHALITAEPLFGAILMALLIGGFFTALIIITRGKGMGGGDVKLGAFIGLGLGFPNAILATLLAFLIGAAVAIFLLILGKKKFGQNIPFGPFLVIGSLIALFWGKQMVDFYLKIGT